MRTSFIALVFSVGLALSSCSRDDHGSADGRATARQAGRDAYRAAQAAKRDAKEAERQLEHASQDFRQGWEEAKHGDGGRPEPEAVPRQKRDREDPRPDR